MNKIIFDLNSKIERRAFVVNKHNKIERWNSDNIFDDNIQGNIYIAKVIYIDFNLKLAFIDYGGKKNGFLSFEFFNVIYNKSNWISQLSKINLSFMKDDHRQLDTFESEKEYQTPEATKSANLSVGQYLIVQAIRNPINNKGASFSTKITFNGKYFVFMPIDCGMIGVSSSIKHVSSKIRKNLFNLLSDSLIANKASVIIKSSGASVQVNKLIYDLSTYVNIWNNIIAKLSYNIKLLHRNDSFYQDIILGGANKNINQIIINNPIYLEEIKKIDPSIKISIQKNIDLYEYDLQILELYNTYVHLKSGGCLIIQKTEALYSIDINSGNIKFDFDISDLNKEAAIESARQIKLRNLSGIIVIDFIYDSNNLIGNDLKEILLNALSEDKVKINVLDMNSLGLICLSRQRSGGMLLDLNNINCDLCLGKGFIRGNQVVYLFKSIEKKLYESAKANDVIHVKANYLFIENVLNLMKEKIVRIETLLNIQINFQIDYNIPYERFLLLINDKPVLRYESTRLMKKNLWQRFKSFFKF